LTVVRQARPLSKESHVRRVVTELKTRSVSWLVLLVVATVALALGLFLGNSTPFGSKKLTVLEGRAFLGNTENWLTSFDTGSPDDQMSFRANAVAWSDGSEHGDDSPPCLKEGRSVPVKVGYTWVDLPDGGRMPVVAWVECLG
jgi:hypothetical protein